MDESIGPHMPAVAFALVMLVAIAYVWTTPKLRNGARWGNPPTGAPISEFSFGAAFIGFLVLAVVEIALALDAPLPEGAGTAAKLARSGS